MTGPEIVVGWDAIARVICACPKSARNWALDKRDPLPVMKHTVKDIVFAYVAALRDWDKRNSLPYPKAVELAKLRRVG